MADIAIATDSQSTGNETSGDGRRLVFTTASIGYIFYVESASDNLQYKKTTDGGATWGSSVDVDTGQIELFTIWYDRWTPGDTGTIIHTFFCRGTTGEVMYRSLDTNGDSLGTAAVIEDDAATSISEATSHISATKARGGNLYVAYYWDTTVDFSNFERSTDGGANWTARTTVWEGVQEQIQLYPGGAADNQDIIAIYWDFSADEISRKIYDDSADSWGETSISTGMVETAKTNTQPQFAGSVRHSDNVIVLVAWTAYDNADAELKCWFVSESAITAKTDVVDNAVVATTDDMGNAAVFINQNNDDIYVFQLGAEGGGETIGALVNVYYYVSTDDGATWSSQTAYSQDTADDHRTLSCDLGGTATRVYCAWFNDDLADFYGNFANSIVITAPGATAVKDVIQSGVIAFAR